MQESFTNSFRFKRNSGDVFVKNEKTGILKYSEKLFQENLVLSLRARALALAIFFYHFFENGTLGILPEKMYYVYRGIRISDIIQYGLIVYSLLCISEYRDYVKSKSFIIIKLLLLYFVLEFIISYFRYHFNFIEFLFRLKGLWSSFLIFPYLLLFRRGGLTFLIKIIFPVACISNILYLITAITGVALLPDVSIIKQRLPGDIEVFRVYGGTFFGEYFFLGFIYYWITQKFKVYQVAFAILFILPHILAFGRGAWVFFVICILLMLLLNSLRKREFRILIRQTVIIVIMAISLMFAFIKFIPESDFYVDALNARIFEAQDDIQHKEGTYGTRVLMQNSALVNLWLNDNLLIGVGMHPMWVYRPESFEEQVYYSAFSDVSWPSVLAAYGLIGFALSAFFQLFFLYNSFRMLRRQEVSSMLNFLLTLIFSKMFFDTFINFSFGILSVGLWGMFGVMNFFTAVMVYAYVEYIENPKRGELKSPMIKRFTAKYKYQKDGYTK